MGLRRRVTAHGGGVYAPSELVPDPGHLYALANESMPGLLKIGMTKRNPRRRAKELESTGVPTAFTVAWKSAPLANVSQAEQAAHNALAKFRVRRRREFFRVSLKTAKGVLVGIEKRHLDSEWLAREKELEATKHRAKAERQRMQEEKRAVSAAVRSEFNEWAARPEVARSFRRASGLVRPNYRNRLGGWLGFFVLVACFGIASAVAKLLVSVDGIPVLVTLVILTPLWLGLVAGEEWLRHRLNERRDARFRQVWAQVEDVTPSWVSSTLFSYGWVSEGHLRAELDKRAPTPAQEKAIEEEIVARLRAARTPTSLAPRWEARS